MEFGAENPTNASAAGSGPPVDPNALARVLVAVLPPEAGTVAPLRWVEAGFGSIATQTAAGLIVRLARQRHTQEAHTLEARVLPSLARLLPVAVPIPRWHLQPAAGIPLGGIAYSALPGTPPVPGQMSHAAQEQLARDLGRFLVQLHHLPVGGVGPLPTATISSAWLAQLRRDIRPTLRAHLTDGEMKQVEGWFASVLASGDFGHNAATVRHGDLWHGNLLLDARGRLSGVIDWEAVALGDPAQDFAVQRYLGEPFLDAVLEAYSSAGGFVDAALRQRIERHWELRELGGIRGAVEMEDGEELTESVEKLRRGPILTAGERSLVVAPTSARRPPRSDQRDKLDTVHLTSPQEARLRLKELRQATDSHIRRSKAPATQRAYASGFGSFALWCEQHGLDALPAEPDTVALYLTALADQDAAVATLRIRLVCIAQAHKAAGFPPPTQSETVRRTMSGIARTKGTRQRQVAPLRLSGLKAMLEATPEDDLIAIRDRAILLLGFAGGMRRSEMAALEVEDLTAVDEGFDVLIRWSKTDQEGAGRTIGIPRGRNSETCPVIAIQRWRAIGDVRGGPLFRRIRPNGRPNTKRRDPLGRVSDERLTPQGIARVVQRAAARAGLDPREFAGHSLRAGFATEAAAQGASERAIMQQTGHKSVAMLRRYIRDGDRYRDNAAAMLGL